MAIPEPDQRTSSRRARDEQLANQPPLAAMDLPADAPATPVEVHLNRNRTHPVAVLGIVENGLVRPLDPAVKLLENARVIIVASE